jgi:hypothetical protein
MQYEYKCIASCEKFFVKEKIVGEGQCEVAAISFMNEQMYKKI